MNLPFSIYKEKPIDPPKVLAVQLTEEQAEGYCFNTGIWSEFTWAYDVDFTPDEFKKQRKIYKKRKEDLHLFVTVNNRRIRFKKNQWIVLDESKNLLEILSPLEFRRKYTK